jgi:ankyrin repeat protein
MVASKTSSYRLNLLRTVSVAALGLLAACGDHGSSEQPFVSTKENGAKTKLTTQCSYVVGHRNKNDELFVASGAGDVRRVKQSIDAGRNANAMDSLRRTPLFAAAFCNRSDVENLLIDKGSVVDARDFLGMSPLGAAVLVGGMDAAKALISRGANINIQTTDGKTPLHMAAATNQVAMVELLLEHGANAQVRDKKGFTAASIASRNGHQTVVATIKKWQEKQETPVQK